MLQSGVKYMGMNQTPASERVHISFFGRRNAGKSSIINAVTGQNLAIVSDVKGTTTDPVYKTMELLPLGPVMVIDTPGIDDEGELGALRVKKLSGTEQNGYCRSYRGQYHRKRRAGRSFD